MTEVWKSIKGYEGFYEVSNLGRIKSLTRKSTDDKTYRGKVLKPSVDSYGYLLVGLYHGNAIQSKQKIHRLVAKAFLTNPEQKPQVNHKDGVKSNNLLSNLEWVTALENSHHSFSSGLKKACIGENSHFSKLTENEAKEIKKILSSKTLTYLQISKLFNVSKSTIAHISKGRNWSKI